MLLAGVAKTSMSHYPGVMSVSLVLGFACGTARLPNSPPAAGPNRPKITRKGAFI